MCERERERERMRERERERTKEEQKEREREMLKMNSKLVKKTHLCELLYPDFQLAPVMK